MPTAGVRPSTWTRWDRWPPSTPTTDSWSTPGSRRAGVPCWTRDAGLATGPTTSPHWAWTRGGVDISPAFIEHARGAHPGARVEVADIDHLPYPDQTFSLVLAWYSTVHHTPDEIHRPLAEFARVLARGGVLILGHFEGRTIQRFDHAVTPAYRWPTSELTALAEHAGFTVIETHQRPVSEHRAHGVIVARLGQDESPDPR